LIGVADSVLSHIAAVSNGNVSVRFDIDRVEIPDIVLLIADPFQEGLPIVDQQRLSAGCPSIAVCERQIRRADTLDVHDVPAYDGCFQRSFEREHFGSRLRGSNRCGGQTDPGVCDGRFGLTECRQSEHCQKAEAEPESSVHGSGFYHSLRLPEQSKSFTVVLASSREAVI